MSLAIAQRVFGSHVYFFQDGAAYTVPGAGTASRTAKPGATDPAYIPLGIVEEDFSISAGGEEIVTKAPRPAMLVDYDVIPVSAEMTLKFTVTEISFLHLQLLWKSLVLTGSSAQLNPMERSVAHKGWLKFQQYDQSVAIGGNPTISGEVYGALKIDGDVQFAKSLIKPKLEFRILHSTLNSLAF
jgi:hypothetical protein